jgi:hypothetical protein
MIAGPESHRLIGLLADDHNTMRTTLGANHADGNAIPDAPGWGESAPWARQRIALTLPASTGDLTRLGWHGRR